MKTEKIFTNNDAVNYDFNKLQTATRELNNVRNFLIEKGLEPSENNVLCVARLDFTNLVTEFKTAELKKLNALIDQFGESEITVSARDAISKKAIDYKNELYNNCPKMDFESLEYLQYFDLVDGVSVNKKYNTDYFIQKNSIVLDGPDLEQYEKHLSALNFLNEFVTGTNFPQGEFHKLFIWEPEKKQYKINMDKYDAGRNIQDYIQKKDRIRSINNSIR